ncbi:MAG: site-specific integrase [Oscillospiraceae bacterium]|nr:site-specific integrase [Oscillospiraceae bacterium]
MPRKPKEKYKTRPNGTKETMRSYRDFGLQHFTGKKHFYGKTDEEIDKKIKAFEDSMNIPPPARTVEDVADEWWEKKQKTISLNSMTSYTAKVNEIISELGDIPVDQLTVQKIYQWLERVAARGYAQRGVNDRKSVLNGILQHAVACGDIMTNPIPSVPPVKGKPAKKRHPASDDDVAKIEAHKTDSLIARLYYFMEYTGCRIGECVVLQEKDIDREAHTATISKDLAFDGQKPVVKQSAKTEAGDRKVILFDNVLEILPQYKDKDTYIFFPDGLPNKSPYETALRQYRRATGVSATAHQLRHTYAGIMHSAEIDAKDTQTLMGHSSILVTQDIYTEIEKQHTSKVRDKANRYVMEERLGKNKKKCSHCGSTYVSAEDGHAFKYCPDCGKNL